jgi:hypothetical protein
LLSAHAAAELTKQTHELIFSANSSWQQTLRAQYPLEAISCAIKKPHHLAIHFSVAAPWLLVNHDKLITQTGLITDRSLFDPVYLEKPTIFLTELSHGVDADVANWLKRHPSSFFSEHTVTIIDKNRIRIVNNSQSRIACLMDSTTPAEKYDTHTIEKIVHQLVACKKIAPKSRQPLIADLRFKNQIVIYHQKTEHSVRLDSTKRSLS